MAIPEEVDLNKLPQSFYHTRNPATGNSIADDVKAGYGAARPRLLKKAVKEGLTPTEDAIVQQTASFGGGRVTGHRTDLPEPVAPTPSPTPTQQPVKAAVPAALNPPESGRIGTPAQLPGGIDRATAIFDNDPNQNNVTAQEYPRGTGSVIDNETGNVVELGNRGYGVSRKNNQFQDAAAQQLGLSRDLMNKEAKSFIAEDGTNVSEGANAVGAGIVARGAMNRAKLFADIGNQQESTDISQQNADTSLQNTNISQQNADTAQFGARNLAADRSLAAQREDLRTQTDVAGKQLQQEQLVRINDLQKAYQAETDPAKRQAIVTEINALTGNSQTEKFQPVLGKDDLGNPTFLGAFDTRTGQLNSNATQQQPAQPTQAPQSAIAYLKKNPSQAAAFKAKYGYLPDGM